LEIFTIFYTIFFYTALLTPDIFMQHSAAFFSMTHFA